MEPTISKQTPAAPSGITPTEVPLNISGTAQEQIIPDNIKVMPSSAIFEQFGRGLYVGIVPVNITDISGSSVFQWSIQKPLFSGNTSFYTPLTNNLSQTQWRLGWELLHPLFCQNLKMDFVIELKPIKVADARVSFDFVFTQEDQFGMVYNSITLANDSVHKLIDDTDSSFLIDVPAIWPANNVNSRNWIFPAAPNIVAQPGNLPYTSGKLFMRNRYHPNNLQPDTWEFLVIIHPKPSNQVGFGGISLVRNFLADTVTDYLPAPWFLANV